MSPYQLLNNSTHACAVKDLPGASVWRPFNRAYSLNNNPCLSLERDS